MSVKSNKSQGWKNILKFVIPYLLVLAIFQVVGMLIAGVDLRHIKETTQTPQQLFITSFISLLGTSLIIWLFRKHVDKKSFLSLGLTRGSVGKDILLGLVIGFVIMLLGFCILIGTNQLQLEKIQFSAVDLLFSFGLFVFVAVSEELLARGYILNNLMVSFNKYVALTISALLFSLLHLANNGVSFTSLAIIFLSGFLLGLPYVYSKKLWFPIALHLSWNFFQGPIFGYHVSGVKIPPLLVTSYKTANIWNGGEFGFEGSLLSVFFLVLALVLVYFIFRNRVVVETEEYPAVEIMTNEGSDTNTILEDTEN